VHHVMLDHFAAGNTPVHRLDPVVKMVGALAAILATVLVGRDHFLPLVPVAAALAVYHAIARIPVRYAVKRLLVISPFAAAVVVLFPIFEPGRPLWTLALGCCTVEVTDAGLARAGHLAAKFVLAAWATLLLLATTRFQDVLQGLARMRVPQAMVVQLAFMYRYLWILVDEVMHLGMARAARDGGGGPWRMRFQSRVGVVGVLFLRTFDRAERIYWAMAARGFDGTVHAPSSRHMAAKDWLLAAGAIAAGAGILIWDHMAYG